MKCPKCNINMEIGQAINYNESKENVCAGFGKIHLTAEQIELIDVYKCPNCGHSDDLAPVV